MMLKELRAAPPHVVIRVALELVARGGWKERFVAYELILRHLAAEATPIVTARYEHGDGASVSIMRTQ